MIKTINFSDFCDAWNNSEDRKNSFSYNGKRALFDYLEGLEQDSETPIELDIVALDCDFTEFADLEEVKAQYGQIESMEDLQDHTTVLEFDNGLIIQNF